MSTATAYPCRRCQRSYTSPQRRQHHWAADHAPRTLKDLRGMRHLRRSTLKPAWSGKSAA